LFDDEDGVGYLLPLQELMNVPQENLQLLTTIVVRNDDGYFIPRFAVDWPVTSAR